MAAVGAAGTPVNVGSARGAFAAKDEVVALESAFAAIELVTVVEKLASSPSAAANSFRVSKVP